MNNSQINNVVGVRPIQAIKKTEKAQRLLQQAPDSFEKKNFNIGDAMKTLENARNIEGEKETPKFNEKNLENLKVILEKTPEKWNSVKALAETSRLKGETIVDLATRRKETLNVMVPFAVEKNVSNKENGKYTDKDIILLADVADNYGTEKLENAKPLIKTQLSGQNVAMISQAPVPELRNKIEKISSKILDMEKAMGNNLEEIGFGQNEYNLSEYVIQASTKDNQLTTELLDENMNRVAIENVSSYQSEGQVYQIKIVNDLRNNTTSEVRLSVDDKGNPTVTHEVRVIKDKEGKVIREEYTSPSEVRGVFDIKYVDSKGKETIVSEGKIDKKTGMTTVRKNMTSLDGTKTEYLYQDDPKGNRTVNYKITDKNGKVLLKNDSTFEKVGKNHYVSTKNNQKYDITFDAHSINVKDMNNKSKEIKLSIENRIKGDKKEILKSLKAMPGEELIKLAESTRTLVGTKDSDEIGFNNHVKEIKSNSDLFETLRALGHARDNRDVKRIRFGGNDNDLKAIYNNYEVQKVCDEERKAFNKAFPDTQRNYIDTFINYDKGVEGLQEIIAESNALLTTPKTKESSAIRSQYLQQYFPRTIAALDVALNDLIMI